VIRVWNPSPADHPRISFMITEVFTHHLTCLPAFFVKGFTFLPGREFWNGVRLGDACSIFSCSPQELPTIMSADCASERFPRASGIKG
jgi:hypothetical protein